MSGVLVVTPEGRLSRYFYGIEYSPKELRLALVDSGEGRVGSVIDELLLYCFHYDPEAGRYGAVVMNLIRLGGVVTLAVMAGFVLLTRRRGNAHARGGSRVIYVRQAFPCSPPRRPRWHRTSIGCTS